MNSLVHEMQELAYHSATSDISSLLRKAFVLAKKLKIKDFELWVHNELNGYKDELIDVPEYRRVIGKVKALNPYRGWVPVAFVDVEIARLMSQAFLRQAIPEIEDLTKTDHRLLVMDFAPETERELSRNTSFPTQFRLEFSTSQAKNVIETVKNIILVWALQLEEDGITGEGMSFTREEKNVAEEKGYTVNHFYGDINQSQIQQNSNQSSQNMHIENGLDVEGAKTLIKLIQDNLSNTGLKEVDQKKIEEEIENLKSEVENPMPHTNMIKKSFKIICGILEKSTSTLIATGLYHEILKYLG